MRITKSDPPTLAHKKKWSADFHDFISICLNKDPNSRPFMTDLVDVCYIIVYFLIMNFERILSGLIHVVVSSNFMKYGTTRQLWYGYTPVKGIY